MQKVLILLKISGKLQQNIKVHGVYENRASLESGIERIKEANFQYKLVQHSDNSWSIGPEEDEGFFGHEKVYLRCQEANFYR